MSLSASPLSAGLTEEIKARADHPLPSWVRVIRPGNTAFMETGRVLRGLKLHSVCEEARCPNIGECFGHGTATFMLMGDLCTRGCRYCAVGKGRPQPLDPDEPKHLADAVGRLGLKHVVLTSVDRDDLEDGGAGHFAKTVWAVKQRFPKTTVEVLIPDFRGQPRALDRLLDSPVDVLNHNTETVPRLYPDVRGGGRYTWALAVLRRSKDVRPSLPTKSGLMLGLGETRDELFDVLRDLRDVDCNILTLGQYLRPSWAHRAVTRFVTPGEFSELKDEAMRMGFRHVESGPLVRSSYHAWEHLS